MVQAQDVMLESAEAEHAPLLANLLELYVHDLSEVFPIEVGADGRFGYDRLPLYWREPERRFPFLIRANGRVVGFTLVTRGSPMTTDPADLDVAEFFVLRRYRRSGVGRRAAFQLWQRMPGHWIVRVSEGNRRALLFWHAIIAEYTGGSFAAQTRPGTPHAWSVLAFHSPP